MWIVDRCTLQSKHKLRESFDEIFNYIYISILRSKMVETSV